MHIVTGGSGFIASHIVDQLAERKEKVCIFDITKPRTQNKWVDYVKGDITKPLRVGPAESVFHYAAEPDVRSGLSNPEKMYTCNVRGTFNVLEYCRKNDVKSLVFASTSAVYGKAKIPTPESTICKPISLYGATKLACESLICSYSNLYGIKSTVLRYANIIGERSTHGVIFDFVNKLKKNPRELEILGNGLQKKSYLYIDDAISATFIAAERQRSNYEVYNVGSDECITVKQIARIVSRSLNCKPKFKFTSNEASGWKGDVPLMLLDCTKLKSLGWSPKVKVKDAILKVASYFR